MAHLPTEIITQIVGELREAQCEQNEINPLAPYACINRYWQDVIESLIWRKMEFSFNELDVFRNLYACVRRRQYLKTLHMTLNGYFENTFDQSSDDESEVESEDETPNTTGTISSEEEDSSDTTESSEEDIYDIADRRVDAVKADHQRFFQETTAVWEELRGWKSNLKLESIQIHVNGQSMYELLGETLRWNCEVNSYVKRGLWAEAGVHPPLPILLSVTSLTVSACTDIDLWPAIVGCDVADSLPNIRELKIHSSDWQKRWDYLRGVLRNILAERLAKLPQRSLRKVELLLPFRYTVNHNRASESYLCHGKDLLSRSLNSISTHLTTLSLNLNQISPALFWNPSIPFADNVSPLTLWPNLIDLHIDTGFETASGRYSMRDYISIHHHRDQYSDPPDPDDVSIADSEQELDWMMGDYPTNLFRERPDPDYFNALSISIARAANCMPKLQSITLEMISYWTDCGAYTGYHGWGFAFRSGPEARYPAAHTREWSGYPGIDMYILERPRSEWVFRCEREHVEWEQPEEARQLWEKRFPGIETHLVTFDIDEEGEDCWRVHDFMSA